MNGLKDYLEKEAKFMGEETISGKTLLQLVRNFEENNLNLQSLQSCVSGSLLLTEEILNEYREYILRTGLADRKSMQNWLEKRYFNRQ